MQIYDGEFDEDILALPDVRSFGKMPSLRVAMQLDESGELKVENEAADRITA
jgi:hypothetical protein